MAASDKAAVCDAVCVRRSLSACVSSVSEEKTAYRSVGTVADQGTMEALQCDIHMTGEHVIVSRGAGSLWCSRRDGSLKPGSSTLTVPVPQY